MQASGDPGSPGPAGHDTGPCPIGQASRLLGDRWILLIVREATLGSTRFDDFRERLGIADNILAARLRRLLDARILVRVPYSDGRRTRREYRLTQAGADLSPVLRALGEWGERHTDGGPMGVVHVGCGGEVGTDRVCLCCGAAVGRDEEAWVRSWRSPEPIPLARPVPAQAEELQDQVHLAGQHGHPRVRDAAAGGRLAQ